VSGTKRRAPDWAQRHGLEWVHRAVTEPRRLIRRYARDLIVFGSRLARQVWANRPVRRFGAGVHEVVSSAGVVTVRFGGAPRMFDEHEWSVVEAAAAAGTRLVVDLVGCARIGGRDVANIVEVARVAARSGGVVEFAHLKPSTRRQLAACRLGHLLR
jgi:hypothetical protein